MSSKERVSVQPAELPRYDVRTDFTMQGERAFNLGQVFGDSGCQALQRTLQSLSARQSRLPGEPTGALDWRRVPAEPGASGESRYELQVAEAHLPAGVNQLTVRVAIRGNLMNISHRAETSVVRTRQSDPSANQLPEGVQNAVQRTVTRAANNLMAYTVASRIREHLPQYVGQRNARAVNLAVRHTNLNQLRIQAYARMRETAR